MNDEPIVTRSIVHKGQIAPKGCAFFVAVLKRDKMIYTMKHLVRTKEIDSDKEQLLKNQFAKILIAKLNEKQGKS